ncbi:MAG: hypothetical protein ACK5NT_06955 [Pyrinomonadaceae bacterium]
MKRIISIAVISIAAAITALAACPDYIIMESNCKAYSCKLKTTTTSGSCVYQTSGCTYLGNVVSEECGNLPQPEAPPEAPGEY